MGNDFSYYERTYNIQDVIRALKCRSVAELNASKTGNFDLLHVVLDSELALEKAGLTDRQKQVIQLYWIEDKTLAEVGGILGISHQAVADSVNQARTRVQKVLDKWGGR